MYKCSSATDGAEWSHQPPRFVRDTSKYWHKPNFSRDDGQYHWLLFSFRWHPRNLVICYAWFPISKRVDRSCGWRSECALELRYNNKLDSIDAWQSNCYLVSSSLRDHTYCGQQKIIIIINILSDIVLLAKSFCIDLPLQLGLSSRAFLAQK